MMKQTERAEQILNRFYHQHQRGITARELAAELGVDRSTASRYLNALVERQKASKMPGRPVRYLPVTENGNETDFTLSPTPDVQNAMLEEGLAALLYPPQGLPILLTGETGVGKSRLAEELHRAAVRRGHLVSNAPFISFNCAEYAQNPELLAAQLFGVKKGAYTGAETDRVGLAEQADGGILFLDEIHRLPPAGQEMLFNLLDQGLLRRLGEAERARNVRLRLIAATTEDPEKALLPALLRRFPVRLHLLPLRERSLGERIALLDWFLRKEAGKMGRPVEMEEECRRRFLQYDFPGNIGQLAADVRIACARAFMRHLGQSGTVRITPDDLPSHLRHGPVRLAVNRMAHASPSAPSNESPAEADNVYALLRELAREETHPAETEHRLHEALNRYVQELTRKSKPPSSTSREDLLQILGEAVREAEQILGRSVSADQIQAMSLHLEAWLARRKDRTEETAPSVPPLSPICLDAARQMAAALEKRLHLRLPPSEIALLAAFLSIAPDRAGKRRAIATVCLTGEGAAITLEHWLKERLPTADRDILIQAVQIDPHTRQSPALRYLGERHRLIAVVGTVPPAMCEAPFLPAWELYRPHGWQKLMQLLEATRTEQTGDPEPLTFASLFPLLAEGMAETVTHFNPRRFIQVLEEEAETLRRLFGWEKERELGIWMHLAVYTDRLLAVQLGKHPAVPVSPQEADIPVPTGEEAFSRLLAKLENVFRVRFPASAAAELARLATAKTEEPAGCRKPDDAPRPAEKRCPESMPAGNVSRLS
jgi:transcriptional regulator with AAA-type ATPase domain